MAIDTTTARSRRALLLGAGGALAAFAAQALGRPLPALAGSGSVALGAVNTSADTTIIRNTDIGNGTEVLRAVNAGNGTAFRGRSHAGDGVVGESSSSASVGVHGYSPGAGVRGDSAAGVGVLGQSESGQGVLGMGGPSGIAVSAFGGSIGLFASASTGDYAIAVDTGRLAFGRNAGNAVIPASARHVTVSPGFVTDETRVLATIVKGHPGGTTTVQRVAKSTDGQSFTIYLTANALNAVTVSWFVFS
jgi:hypothetical protein